MTSSAIIFAQKSRTFEGVFLGATVEPTSLGQISLSSFEEYLHVCPVITFLTGIQKSNPLIFLHIEAHSICLLKLLNQHCLLIFITVLMGRVLFT